MKGSQIRKVRDALGLKPAELAAALGVATGTLKRWEKSNVANVVGFPLALFIALDRQRSIEPAAAFTIVGERVRISLVMGGALSALRALLDLALPPTQTATGGTPTAATSPASKPRRSRAS